MFLWSSHRLRYAAILARFQDMVFFAYIYLTSVIVTSAMSYFSQISSYGFIMLFYLISSLLSYLILSCLVLSRLVLSCLVLSCLVLSYLIPYLISSHLISSHLISSHLISSHLISSHLISSYLILSCLSYLLTPKHLLCKSSCQYLGCSCFLNELSL